MPVLKKCYALARVAALALGALAAFFCYWAMSPLKLSTSTLDVTIKPYTSVRSVTEQLNEGGVWLDPDLFVLMTRLLGLQSKLKSGNYMFKRGITPYQLLQKLSLGDANQAFITVIEGWTFKRMRAELDANPALRHDTQGLSDHALLMAIGASPIESTHAEGLFFPDTYLFEQNTSDLDLYRRAYQLMQRRLDEAWAARATALPYKNVYEALIMASLIEKETGKASDRPLVAAVLINRLRIGMPLQTDPTVIYGIGQTYTGRLRKHDLHKDTPYNTYTRLGLPPTPIALPGAAALQAAMNPAQTNALYFVASHGGASVFSDTLVDHNKAVDQYIRGQR